MMSAIIDARNVSYTVGARRIVDGASLALAAGRLAVVVGPNGAGKSTLLKLLAGEIKPTDGEIRYDGAPIRALPAWRLACMRAVMAQSGRLSTAFSVQEVARFSADFVGRRISHDAMNTIVSDSLAEARVLHLADRDFTTLSGGEQQRVRFAAALGQLQAGRTVAPAQVLFLDEPIASLDLDRQLSLMDAAAALGRTRNVAVMAILHDLNMAVAYADDLIVMKDGRIVAQGHPHEILTETLVTEVFNVTMRRHEALPGDVPVFLPQHHTFRKSNWPRRP